MSNVNVERLLVNSKTLEDCKSFQEYGLQELTMLEDVEKNLVENDSESRFYDIYVDSTLVARMSVYKISVKFAHFFLPSEDYFVLWKLEVVPEHRGNNYARLLVDYAKQYQLPIKTNPFIDSHGFWKHMGFEKASYNMERDLGENPYIWMPKGVQQV